MLDDAVAAAAQIFTPPFRKVLFKTLALTLALLVLAWIGLEKLILAALTLPIAAPYPWVTTALSIVGGVGLVIGLAFLVYARVLRGRGVFLRRSRPSCRSRNRSEWGGPRDAAWRCDLGRAAVRRAGARRQSGRAAAAARAGRQRDRLFRGPRAGSQFRNIGQTLVLRKWSGQLVPSALNSFAHFDPAKVRASSSSA